MCGICGFISKKNIDETALIKMRDSLTHRGPDDAGEKIECINGYNIGLAHRRLSIIDLSSNGRQPMTSVSDRVSVVFNGEIYNYKEIKNELLLYPFKSNTDTEVILAAYEKYGVKFINRCNGMFAIALLDRSKGILYLIRDRMGQKPLYYFYDGDTVIFGSGIKPLMLYPGIQLKINKSVLRRYLVKQCIVSPDTIFEKVYKVEPGEVVSIQISEEKGMKLKKRSYWNINEAYQNKKNKFVGTYLEAKRQLMVAMKKSINYRMFADVPVGILLSGGYDSSVIAALAQRECKNRIKTYSIGIKNSSLNEACYAKKVADYIGSEHHELYISKNEMLAMVEKIPQYYDEPFADSSQIATMLVSRLAKQDVTVVLTGDGGDELFAGYPIYVRERVAQKADIAGKALYSIKKKASKMYGHLPFSVRMIAENTDDKTKTQFNYKAKIDIVRKMLNQDSIINENYDESDIPSQNWSIRRMLLDSQTYLPDDLHCKVDRASMMFSLEARSPFMDVNVIELALSMPYRYKLRRRKGKRILKDIAWNLLPKELLDRPKSGFEVPIDDWLRNELRDKLLNCSREDFLKKQGIFNPVETEKVINDYLNNDVNMKKGQKLNTVIWSFFVFQLWYKEYIEDVK